MLKVVLLLALCAIAALQLRLRYRSPATLRAIAAALRGGAPLVDVRTPAEFAGGHPPGAINIPLAELQSRVGKLRKQKSKTLVLCCASGARSRAAARLLHAAGIDQVLDLGPGSNHRRLPAE